jgi:hypothetical protein
MLAKIIKLQEGLEDQQQEEVLQQKLLLLHLNQEDNKQEVKRND